MIEIKLQNKIFQFLVFSGALLVGLFLSFLIANKSHAANFSISPASGTYSIGSTFDVSILVDTKGQEINAVQMQLAFPADKLQLVSPSAGSSIIEIYTTPPKFDNSTGRVEIVGGIPNGINVSSGLITKLTFRVKGVGAASLRFTGESQILLNDGRGTNVLDNTFGASYKLELPPQQGPIVISDTHPDQESWYRDSNVGLQWDIGLPPADNYSYSISDNPTDVPDDVPETKGTTIGYKDVPNGINYFHIKAFREGRWGGVSHYSLKIDNQGPADFKIGFVPGPRTFLTKVVVDFTTTDSLSGLDRYELKILPLKVEGRSKASVDDQLFIETISPYQTPDLLYGSYEVIVRAYDKAGNFREVSRKLEISNSWFWFLGQDGVSLPFGMQLSWNIALPSLLILILLLIFAAYYFRRTYLLVHNKVESNHLPETVASQLTELQKYREKYGKLAMIFMGVIISGAMIFNAQSSYAQTAVPVSEISSSPTTQSESPVPTLESSPTSVVVPQTVSSQLASEQLPPVITSYSANIKDDELFYVSGRTTEPTSSVVVHLQSLVDGSAFDFSTTSDKRGDWTYRHSDFLPGGKYIIWAHTKVGSQLSSPSPQVEMDVKPIAINWGNSRITYQSIYIGMIVSLLLILLALLIYIIIHAVLVRHRRKIFSQNLRQAEDSIKRGFITLRRDIEAELLLMKQAHLNEELTGEQKIREEQLKADLKNIEDLVGQEVWQVETFEHLPTNSSQ